MEVTLGDDEHLKHLAKDITTHYTNVCENKTDVVQKAMIVCSKRKIAYRLLEKFRAQNPHWFEEKKSSDNSKLKAKQLTPANAYHSNGGHTCYKQHC